MSLELKIDTRIAKINVIQKEGSIYKVEIDGRVYDLDIEKVQSDSYSIIMNGKSIDMEMIEGDTPYQYKVNTLNNHYEIEVIDATARYKAMSKSRLNAGGNTISTPMPGKIIKIPVNEGDQVEKGQTVITVSAMKMESEYKSATDGVVKKIHVKPGDNVEGHQPLIEIEAL